MIKHSWENQGEFVVGPDENGNDQPCDHWFCARCGTIAWTFGHYFTKGKSAGKRTRPQEPSDRTFQDANGERRVVDCDEQIVINIMTS